MENIEDDVRTRIAKTIPQTIEKVMKSHQEFLEATQTEGDTTSSKLFKEKHDACKMAIAHVELLLKLAKWAGAPDMAQQKLQDEAVLQEELESVKQEKPEGEE